MTGLQCALFRGASIRPSVGTASSYVRTSVISHVILVSFFCCLSKESHASIRGRGEFGLMMVSRNFRHQGEGDSVVVDREYAKGEIIKTFIDSYNYRLLSYFILFCI